MPEVHSLLKEKLKRMLAEQMLTLQKIAAMAETKTLNKNQRESSNVLHLKDYIYGAAMEDLSKVYQHQENLENGLPNKDLKLKVLSPNVIKAAQEVEKAESTMQKNHKMMNKIQDSTNEE